MSLAGSRPLLMEYLDRYSPEQLRHHTGRAWIDGRSAISWDLKLAYDTWYVDHWSLWLDLRILAVTVWCGLRGTGIAHGDTATMPRFRRREACDR